MQVILNKDVKSIDEFVLGEEYTGITELTIPNLDIYL